MQEIYKITPELLKDKDHLYNHIYRDMKNNYYWSDNWSETFYIELAKAGFIATSYDALDTLILLPEMQFSYAILQFHNIHISKKVRKLLKKDNVTLSFNTRFDEVLETLDRYHKYNWLKGEYANLMKRLYRGSYENFELFSVELSDTVTGELIAAEIGYAIGTTYTSLSGFSSRKKEYASYGTLQLVLLAQYLNREGFILWNLGHPYMEYKKRLGSETVERELFLKMWSSLCKQKRKSKFKSRQFKF